MRLLFFGPFLPFLWLLTLSPVGHHSLHLSTLSVWLHLTLFLDYGIGITTGWECHQN